MSALSKAFVAILVVLSLLLSSAVIVWVNKTEAYKSKIEVSKQAAESARKAAVDAQAAEAAAKTAMLEASKNFNTKIEEVQTDLKNREQELSKKEIQIADLTATNKQQHIATISQAEALRASEAQKSEQQKTIAQLRTYLDDLTKQNAQLNTALSDTSNKLDVMTKEWKYMKEQLTELQTGADKLARQVKDLGGNPSAPVAGLKAGAPPINGVVKDVRKLDDNRQWATISVGSADAVQKGMEFKVIDRTAGTFLGIITIETVQPNEAIGVLTGPKVNDVKVGNEVRTQL